MTTQPEWPRIAVVGAGAVGGYFGGMLSRAGAPVAMIGRQTFADAVKRNGLFLDTGSRTYQISTACSTPSYTTKPSGMGIGLAISRSIEAHGGRLVATKNAPYGAVFRFTLPTGGREMPTSSSIAVEQRSADASG